MSEKQPTESCTLETQKLDGYGRRVKMTVLDSGATVVTLHDLKSKVAKFRLTFATGSMHDAIPGEAHFLEHMVFEGPSRGHMHPRLRDFESRGIEHLNASTGMGFTRYFATTFAQHGDALLECLFSIVTSLDFRERDVQSERRVIRTEMGQDVSHRFEASELPRLAFPDCDAYKHPVIGYESSIANITRESLLRRHAATYTAANLLIMAAGDVRHKNIVRLAAKLSANLPQGTKRSAAQTWHQPVNGRHEFQKPFIRSNEMQLIFDGLKNRDFRGGIIWPLVVHLLLGPKHGSMFHDLRVKRRLAYTITASSYEDPIDSFNFSIKGLERDRIDEAESRMHAILRKHAKVGFEQKKIDVVKNDWLLRHAIDGYSRRVLDVVEDDLLYGRIGKRPDRKKVVCSTTNEELTEFMNSFYNPDRFTRFVLLPSK